MFIKQFDIVRLRNVCLISIVLAKSFNLIPMSKKVRNFFSLYGFFLQCLYGSLRKSSGNNGLATALHTCMASSRQFNAANMQNSKLRHIRLIYLMNVPNSIDLWILYLRVSAFSSQACMPDCSLRIFPRVSRYLYNRTVNSSYLGPGGDLLSCCVFFSFVGRLTSMKGQFRIRRYPDFGYHILLTVKFLFQKNFHLVIDTISGISRSNSVALWIPPWI